MQDIIWFIALIISIILHEIGHGYTAFKFGDSTAKNAGRLTLNPIPHIDILGSIILPALFFMSGSSFMIGWAKPVPINPRFFKIPLKGIMWVSLSGPLTNLSLAILASALLRLLLPFLKFQFWYTSSLTVYLAFILKMFLIALLQVNVFLAVFNLIPVPPLDGSKVLLRFLPYKLQKKMEQFQQYGFLLIFVLAYFGILGMLIRLFALPIINLLIKGL